MENLEGKVRSYLEYCEIQKRLDEKTLKAYWIDLRQFLEEIVDAEISVDLLEEYISKLHEKFKPKTVKRKIASLKAFFHYLEYKEMIDRSTLRDGCDRVTYHASYVSSYICDSLVRGRCWHSLQTGNVRA